MLYGLLGTAEHDDIHTSGSTVCPLPGPSGHIFSNSDSMYVRTMHYLYPHMSLTVHLDRM